MSLRLITLFVCCSSLLTHAAQGVYEPVQQCHEVGSIRVFYFLEGPHAVDGEDANRSGIPDQVEDLATQTKAAEMLFVDVLGFTDPLKAPVFRQARYLDIHLRSKQKLGKNGVAYDELQSYKRASDPPGTKSLCFNVATSVKPRSNLTPAHEYFHLVQYGSTRLKVPWFTEGTARWSEYALKEGGLGRVRTDDVWPLTVEKQDALFKMSYEASEHFWNGLAARTDSIGKLPDAPRLAELRVMTYADGKTKVLKDSNLTGWQFMRELLKELDHADDLAFKNLGYAKWSETNQVSSANNTFILQAVEAVMERVGKSR